MGWSPTALYLLAALGSGWRVVEDDGYRVSVRHLDGREVQIEVVFSRDLAGVRCSDDGLRAVVSRAFAGTWPPDAIQRWNRNRQHGVV